MLAGDRHYSDGEKKFPNVSTGLSIGGLVCKEEKCSMQAQQTQKDW